MVSTIAGTGTSGFSGDGGLASDAEVSILGDLEVDDEGRIFVVANRRVRMIDTDGIITTVAGTGQSGFSGDGGPATDARINVASGLALGADGEIYLSGPARVRMVDADGIIDTVVGTGVEGSSGDGGPATEAEIDPRGLAVEASGDLLIADLEGRSLRRVTWHGGIEGVVVDDGGAPAVGVVVSLVADWPAWLVVDTTVTDGSGRYAFEGVDPGGYRVRFFDPQGRFERTWWDGDPTYRSADTVTAAIGSTQTADAMLPGWTTGVLRGQVTDDASGDVLAGAVVLVFTGDGYVAGVRTGPNGYFHLRGLPAGDYRVWFRGPAPGSYTPEWYDGASTPAGADTVTLGAATVTVDAALESTG